MIRRAIVCALALVALFLSIQYCRLLLGYGTGWGWSRPSFFGFALALGGPAESFAFRDYGGFACLAINDRWGLIRPANTVLVPLWALQLIFWAYPLKRLVAYTTKHRLVERDWFARAIGMFAFALSFIGVVRFLRSDIYMKIERIIRSPLIETGFLLFLLIAVPAAGALGTHAFLSGPIRRKSFHNSRKCVECGYNLTGNLSGICPECGNEVQS